MGASTFGTNHPLAVKLWSRKLFQEALKACYFNKFVGEGSSNLIQLKTDTQKGPGDRITIGLRMQLSGTGIAGDDTLEGNEEALTTYNDNVLIDQLRHAVVSGGKMTEQRIPFSVREEARQGLTDWWADRLDTALFNQLAGFTTVSDLRLSGQNATVAPTATTRIICGGGEATEASLSATTTHQLTLADIDKVVARIKVASPMFRPCKVEGKDYYVGFIHPYQTYRLRQQTSAGQWADIQASLLKGGQAMRDNPIFSGALGIYNGVILHESARVPIIAGTPASGSATDYRRAIICGAQAAAVAFGQNNTDSKMSWVEEQFDYGNKLGVSAGSIFGVKKTVFNSTDFATHVISSYAPAL